MMMTKNNTLGKFVQYENENLLKIFYIGNFEFFYCDFVKKSQKTRKQSDF